MSEDVPSSPLLSGPPPGINDPPGILDRRSGGGGGGGGSDSRSKTVDTNRTTRGRGDGGGKREEEKTSTPTCRRRRPDTLLGSDDKPAAHVIHGQEEDTRRPSIPLPAPPGRHDPFEGFSVEHIMKILPTYIDKTDRYVKRLEEECGRKEPKIRTDDDRVAQLQHRVDELERSMRLVDLIGYACFLSGHKTALSLSSRKKKCPGALDSDGHLQADIVTELKDTFGAHVVGKNSHHVKRQVRLCLDRTSTSPTLQGRSVNGTNTDAVDATMISSHAIRRASYISAQDWKKTEDGGREERFEVLKELLQTEEHYHEYLGTMIEDFQRPLMSKVESLVVEDLVLSKQNISTLFCNIEELRSISAKLALDIRNIFEDPDVSREPGSLLQCQSIAALFSANRFDAFVKYVANASEMQRTLTSMLKSSKKFALFCESTSEHSDTMNGLHLSDLLIMPVQRLPRYTLFLKDLVHTISEKHQRQSGLCLAMDQLKEVGRKVESFANMAKLRQLQERFSRSAVQIVKKDRRLVSEGALTKKTGYFSAKRHMVLLFNDSIMFYSDTTNEVEQVILLVDVIDVQITPGNEKGFELICEKFASVWAPEGVLLLDADNKYERISWMNSLLHLLESQKNRKVGESGRSKYCEGVCGTKHDHYSRRCAVCHELYCRDCKKRAMAKIDAGRWICKKHKRKRSSAGSDDGVPSSNGRARNRTSSRLARQVVAGIHGIAGSTSSMRNLMGKSQTIDPVGKRSNSRSSRTGSRDALKATQSFIY